jgi:hypothetical protein
MLMNGATPVPDATITRIRGSSGYAVILFEPPQQVCQRVRRLWPVDPADVKLDRFGDLWWRGDRHRALDGAEFRLLDVVEAEHAVLTGAEPGLLPWQLVWADPKHSECVREVEAFG